MVAKDYLYRELVEKHSENCRKEDDTAPRFQCHICYGAAETEAGTPSMHDERCPLTWWGMKL